MDETREGRDGRERSNDSRAAVAACRMTSAEAEPATARMERTEEESIVERRGREKEGGRVDV